MKIIINKDKKEKAKKTEKSENLSKKQEKKQEERLEKSSNPSYSAKDIYVLEGLEPVRKRPGMYIGSTGPDGLHHLIWEVVDNSIDEAMVGFAKNITIEILENNIISVTDDGRGIPVDIHPQTKKSALETVMCTLHAGGKFGGESYKVSGGLHGVGVSVVNALSKWLKVEVQRDGATYVQEYERGIPKHPVKKVGKAESTGTKVTFAADELIFQKIDYDTKKIVDHVRQQSYLTKGVRMNIIDYRQKPNFRYSFYFDGGLKSFLKYLAENKKTIQDNFFYILKTEKNIEVEAAFTYIDDQESQELSFANNIYTSDGGSHLSGFRSALTRTFNDYAKKEEYIKNENDTFTGDDVREGLIAIISIKIREPQFEGQTKARLGNPEAKTAVESVISSALKEFLEKHPQDAKRIIEKNIIAAKARKAAKAAKETIIRKGVLEGLTLPGKLADCSTKKMEEAELFIVEGDSAGGSAKQGRDRRFQAILPLRGKIMNVEKSRLDKMLINKEIKSLVVALGTAISENFDISKLRYNKIIIMTDADVDGAHIRTLLLTLFYRYFPQIIEDGHLYIAQPPLYRIQKGKEIFYAYSDNEKEKIVKTLGETGVNIQRYKGLGEMNPNQLWETTMNPEVRLLKRITIDDAIEADKMFDILMGEEVEPRKNFIQAHATSVKNLDI